MGKIDSASDVGRAVSGFAEALSNQPRAQTLARAAMTDEVLAGKIQRAMAQAEVDGHNRALLRVLGENIGVTDLPRPRREPSFLPEEPVGPTPRADDLGNVRRMVGDELGPVGDMPEPFVRDAHAALDGTMGGEDLVGRLGASGPRPQYSIDLPNNTRAVTQWDTASRRALPTADVRRAHARTRDNWPHPYDSTADDIMDPGTLADFSPAEQRVLRELEANGWLGFDYPSQAMDAVLQVDGPARWEMSPELLRAREALVSPAPRPAPGFSVADIFPGAPAGTPPRGFEVPFPESRGLVPSGERGLIPAPSRGLVPQERGLIPLERGLSTIPDAPRRPRLEGPEQLRIEGPEQLRIEGPRRAGLEAPGVAAERNAMDDLARAVDADAARRGTAPDGDFRFEPGQRRGGGGSRGGGKDGGGGWKKAALAAGAAAAGAAGVKIGLDAMWPLAGERDSQDTADLAAEQNPPPAVMTQEPAPIRPAAPMTPPAAPVDYSAMARDKIRQANEIQRREGRVTPESAALAREADALYRRSADERAAGRGQPIMPSEQANNQTSAVRAEGRRQMAQNPGSDPRSQARNLLGRINAGEFGNGPQRQQAVNEVNRLFAMADAQRYGR